MQKIVINKYYGGFGLSHEAIMLYAKLSGFKLYPFVDIRDKDGNLDYGNKKYKLYKKESDKDSKYDIIYYTKKPLKKDGSYVEDSWFRDNDIPRDDKNLVKVVKKLKEKANDKYANLKIVKIPDNIKWTIGEYDGMESVEENHRIWD